MIRRTSFDAFVQNIKKGGFCHFKTKYQDIRKGGL